MRQPSQRRPRKVARRSDFDVRHSFNHSFTPKKLATHRKNSVVHESEVRQLFDVRLRFLQELGRWFRTRSGEEVAVGHSHAQGCVIQSKDANLKCAGSCAAAVLVVELCVLEKSKISSLVVVLEL